MVAHKHCELIKLWAEDTSIEFQTSINNGCDWNDCGSDPTWSRQRLYRIKQQLPSIDWSHVGSEYGFLTRNADGICHLHSDMPYEHGRNGKWYAESGYFDACCFASLDAGDCDWKNSLVVRP